MKKTGIFYSFNTKKTKLAAEKIRQAFNENVEMVNAEDLTEDLFMKYDNLILGLPTWFDGELPNYWDEFVPALEELDLKGKTFALFGLGDQIGYPENFGDAVGIMAEIIEELGGKVVGETSAEGYQFEKSKALRNEQFIGLMLDFDNQKKLSDKRIEDWVKKLKKAF